MVNEWTRYDLPSVMDLARESVDAMATDPSGGADAALDVVVGYLNAHHPKPDGTFAVMLEDTHRAQRERDVALRKKGEAFDRAVRAERERDEWKARAEAAEARTAVTREDVEKVVHGSGGGFFDSRLDAITDAVCALFGIEAEQAVDPVEELAGQIESATREAIRQVCVDLADVVPSLDPLAVERAMEVTAASRKVAAHVLGQEATR